MTPRRDALWRYLGAYLGTCTESELEQIDRLAKQQIAARLAQHAAELDLGLKRALVGG